VVYAKRSFGGPDAVLAYLSCYTHRVAIANSRLVAFDGERVTFKWKDYRAKADARYLRHLMTSTLLPPSHIAPPVSRRCLIGDACPPPIATVGPAVDRQNGDRSLQDHRSDPSPEAFRTPASEHLLTPLTGRRPKTLNMKSGSG
jgi:hypothetical protein